VSAFKSVELAQSTQRQLIDNLTSYAEESEEILVISLSSSHVALATNSSSCINELDINIGQCCCVFHVVIQTV